MSEQRQSIGVIAIALAVVAVIGLPGVLIAALLLTRNLLLALALMVVYGGVAVIVGWITGLWQRVQTRLVQGTDNDLQSFFQRKADRKYRQVYLQHLIYTHRTFDVKGMSTQGPYALELEKVFVDLNISLEARFSASVIPAELRSGRHSIWEYLNNSQVGHVAVIGPPGCGKTTLLKYLALTLAGGIRQGVEPLPDRLPVLLYLRDHAKTIGDNPHTPLVTLIQDGLALMPEKVPDRWFLDYLRNGHCLVMLDGLDEVAGAAMRSQVVRWVEDQIKVLGGNCFVVTSHPRGYRSHPISGLTQLEVRPFNRAQVEKFVRNWYLANDAMSHQKRDPGVEMETQKTAEDLLRRIRNASDITDLAVNPLLLNMMANVHRYRSSLPGRRVELYAEMCEVLLGKRQVARGLPDDLTPAQKQSVLQPLAYNMMLNRQREIRQEQALPVIADPLQQVAPSLDGVRFLEMIQHRSGVLVRRASGVYGFAHQTFQEYFAAAHFQQEQQVDELVWHVADDWWHETIRLYCARVDATPVIAACLDEDPPPLPLLILAMECSEEALKVQPEVRQRLEQVLERDLESNDPIRRRVAAQAQLASRLKRLDDNTYADAPLLTHAEYQLFLDESEENAFLYTPAHWEGARFTPGQGKTPAVGMSHAAAEAFCDWLTARAPDLEWYYRLPEASEADSAGEHCWLANATLYPSHPVTLLVAQWVIAEDGSLDEADLAARSVTLENYHSDRRMVMALAVARALARALARARVHADALARTFALARDVDLALAHADARDLDLALALAYARARARAYAYARARTRARARALAYDLARDLAYALASGLASGQDLTRTLARDLARTLARDLADAQDLAAARDLARTLARDLVPTSPGHYLVELFQEVAQLIVDYLALAAWLGDPTTPLSPVDEPFKRLDEFRKTLLADVNAHYARQPRRSLLGKNEEWDIWNAELDERLEAYAALALLERRRCGEWEAFEGIRIVKARRTEEEKTQ